MNYSLDIALTNLRNVIHNTCPRFVFLRHKYVPKNKPITEKIVTVAMTPDIVVRPILGFNFVSGFGIFKLLASLFAI